MKKLFAFILAFLILFSGCGWNVEIVDPREEPSEPENEAFEPEEPENEVQKTESEEKATFRLGPEGESIELAIGDTIGGWTLESFEKESEGIEAVFAGNISVDCTVEKSPMASDEPVYIFTVMENSASEMPFYFDDERAKFYFEQDSESKNLERFESLELEGEMFCRVKLSKLCYSCLPMAVHSKGVIEGILFDVDYSAPEPEKIAKHMEALNQIVLTRFFAETDSETEYVPLYKEKSEGPYWDKTPDLLVPAKDYDIEKYPNYYTNESLENCYEITNFSSEQEIADYISQWVSPEVFLDEEFKIHILEFDGKAYLMRYSRGYGMAGYKNAAILSETEAEIVAEAVIYHGGTPLGGIGSDAEGILRFVLEKNADGNWIVASIEKIYFSF